MRNRTLFLMIIALTGGLIAAFIPRAAATDEQPEFEYTVTAVDGKLERLAPAPEVRLEPGAAARAGDVLRTGWFSSAELEVPSHRSRFTIGARTRVRLSGTRPGILLEVERGRLRAVFDRFEGDEAPERKVVTPSAVLAVRGTEYGVGVSKSGETLVVVFSGSVEVSGLKTDRGAIIVGKGQSCTIDRHRVPSEISRHGMAGDDWDHGHTPGSRRTEPGMDMPDRSGRPRGSTGTGHGGGGGHG